MRARETTFEGGERELKIRYSSVALTCYSPGSVQVEAELALDPPSLLRRCLQAVEAALTGYIVLQRVQGSQKKPHARERSLRVNRRAESSPSHRRAKRKRSR